MRKLLNRELNRKTLEQFRKSEKSPFLLVLDNVRSQSNVGSIFRTADAFLTEAIYICGITARPPHREIQKTALGATESVTWKYFPRTIDAINNLKKEGYKIIGIEQAEGSVELQNMRIDKEIKYALVFGHEINGITQPILDKSHKIIKIPMYGTKSSLNVATAAGIVMFEAIK